MIDETLKRCRIRHQLLAIWVLLFLAVLPSDVDALGLSRSPLFGGLLNRRTAIPATTIHNLHQQQHMLHNKRIQHQQQQETAAANGYNNVDPYISGTIVDKGISENEAIQTSADVLGSPASNNLAIAASSNSYSSSGGGGGGGGGYGGGSGGSYGGSSSGSYGGAHGGGSISVSSSYAGDSGASGSSYGSGSSGSYGGGSGGGSGGHGSGGSYGSSSGGGGSYGSSSGGGGGSYGSSSGGGGGGSYGSSSGGGGGGSYGSSSGGSGGGSYGSSSGGGGGSYGSSSGGGGGSYGLSSGGGGGYGAPSYSVSYPSQQGATKADTIHLISSLAPSLLLSSLLLPLALALLTNATGSLSGRKKRDLINLTKLDDTFNHEDNLDASIALTDSNFFPTMQSMLDSSTSGDSTKMVEFIRNEGLLDPLNSCLEKFACLAATTKSNFKQSDNLKKTMTILEKTDEQRIKLRLKVGSAIGKTNGKDCLTKFACKAIKTS